MPNVTFLPWKKQNTAVADLQWRSAHPDTGRPNKIQPTVGAMSLESLASPRSNAGTVDGQTASAVQGQTWSFQPGLGRIGDRPNNLTNANDWSTERHLRFSQLPLLFVQVQKTGQVVTLAKKAPGKWKVQGRKGITYTAGTSTQLQKWWGKTWGQFYVLLVFFFWSRCHTPSRTDRVPVRRMLKDKIYKSTSLPWNVHVFDVFWSTCVTEHFAENSTFLLV